MGSGGRQAGRQCAASVIHCGAGADDIAAAIALALTPEARNRAATAANPYYRDDTPRIIAEAILSHLPLSIAKTFHDIPNP